MLRVTIELLPGGDASRASTLHVVDIANVSGLADVSDYAVTMGDRQATVRQHPREEGAVLLAARALDSLVDRATTRSASSMRIPPRVAYVHAIGTEGPLHVTSRCGRYGAAKPEAETDGKLTHAEPAVTCPVCLGGGS